MHPGARFQRLRRYERFRALEGEVSMCINCLHVVAKLITAECGHDICMSCFTTSSCCMACREFSQLRTLQDDIVMYPEGEGMCEIHREDQKLFCDRNKTLLCVTCSKAEDHNNHVHWSTAVAALYYRKKILIKMEMLCRKKKRVQELLLKEKERPLIWAVIGTNSTINQKIFHEIFLKIWQCLKKKKEKAKVEELIRKKKFSEHYQRLKEMEAIQEHQIMEQKKEWEAMMSSQSRLLADIITKLEEKMKKPDIEMLQDVAEILERSSFWPNLESFIPRMDASYLQMVMEFLKLFQRYERTKIYNFYNLSEEKNRAIRIVPGFSGKKYPVYIFGTVQAEDFRQRIFVG